MKGCPAVLRVEDTRERCGEATASCAALPFAIATTRARVINNDSRLVLSVEVYRCTIAEHL